MVALTDNAIRAFGDSPREQYPVRASTVVYEGAAVGEDAAGNVRGLVAADKFLGFAIMKADNATGAAGDVNVDVLQSGKVTLLVAGAGAQTINDRPAVYASDDNTFTLTSTGNSKIGYVSGFRSATSCIVEFDARGI